MKCRICGEYKELNASNYHRDKKMISGFKAACKDCTNRRWREWYYKPKPKNKEDLREYAVYKGEDLISMGTISEIAKELDVKEATVEYWRTPSYKKRRASNSKAIVYLGDEEYE